MNIRIINLLLLVSSLICYLEWGRDNSGFLFQVEYAVFAKASADSFLHPLVLIPLIGQILLLVSTFKKQPSKRLTLIGLLLIGVLVLMVSLVGLLSMNAKIVASTVPFIFISVFFILKYRKLKS